MALSVHDNLLISYEVQCEARLITLRTEFRAENKPAEFTNIVFKGVQGYSFENDAFGNIIFDVQTILIELFLKQYGAEILESYRMAGSPGRWAENIGTASEYLQKQGMQGFILSSSYGLSGWILAREVSTLPANQRNY
ncbi:MAG: hypothetical protein WCD49_01450 [Candidatus Acidiferrales bacterium]